MNIDKITLPKYDDPSSSSAHLFLPETNIAIASKNILIDSSYDKDKIPPDIILSLNHGKSKRVAMPVNYAENRIVCPCCKSPLETQEISVCASKEIFNFLGIEIPLFLYYSIFSIIFLLILFIIASIYGIITNIQLGSKYQYYETETFLNSLSSLLFFGELVTKEINEDARDIYYNYSWLQFCAIFVIIIYLHIIRIYQKILSLKRINHPGNYAVMIKNLPQINFDKNDFIEFLKTKWKEIESEELDIIHIECAYEINKLTEMIREKHKLSLKRKKAEYIFKKNGTYPSYYNANETDRQKQLFENKLIEIEKNTLEMINNKKMCGIIFVIFDNIKQKDIFLYRYKMNFSKKIYKIIKNYLFPQDINKLILNYHDKELEVLDGIEPSDIIWENLEFSENYKLKKRFFSRFVASFLLILSFIFLFLIRIQNVISGDNSNTTVLVIGNICIFLINFLLNKAVTHLEKEEKYNSHSLNYYHLTRKLSVVDFFNTGMLILVFNLITHYYNIYYLTKDLFVMFIINAILPQILRFIDYNYLKKIIFRPMLKTKEYFSIYTQSETNDIFENPSLNLCHEYSSILKTLLLTGSFSIIFPIGVLISLFALILNYWCCKYLLVKRYSRPHIITYGFNSKMLDLLNYIPLLISFGGLVSNIIENVIFGDKYPISASHILASIFSILNWILSKFEIDEFFFNKYFNKGANPLYSTNLTYRKQKQLFNIDYESTNPVKYEIDLKKSRNPIINIEISDKNIQTEIKKDFENQNDDELNIENKSIIDIEILKSITHYAMKDNNYNFT